MEKSKNDNSLLLSNKFGRITAGRVVLFCEEGKSETVSFESIEKVNLVKYRVLYTNGILLVFSLTLLIGSFLGWHPQKPSIYFLLISGIGMFFYALTHKFYHYKLIVKEKNDAIHSVKTNQFRRKCIKDLYHSLVRYAFKKRNQSG